MRCPLPVQPDIASMQVSTNSSRDCLGCFPVFSLCRSDPGQFLAPSLFQRAGALLYLHLADELFHFWLAGGNVRTAHHVGTAPGRLRGEQKRACIAASPCFIWWPTSTHIKFLCY